MNEPASEESKPYSDCFTCGLCNGSGFVPRDPDIGTDQECPSCHGSGEEVDE